LSCHTPFYLYSTSSILPLFFRFVFICPLHAFLSFLTTLHSLFHTTPLFLSATSFSSLNRPLRVAYFLLSPYFYVLISTSFSIVTQCLKWKNVEKCGAVRGYSGNVLLKVNTKLVRGRGVLYSLAHSLPLYLCFCLPVYLLLLSFYAYYIILPSRPLQNLKSSYQSEFDDQTLITYRI
jgi:hypothetical protein